GDHGGRGGPAGPGSDRGGSGGRRRHGRSTRRRSGYAGSTSASSARLVLAEIRWSGAETVAMTSDRHGWQLERRSAELYERLLVPTATEPWARDLVQRGGPGRGDRVVDVACGTGVVARLAAVDVGDSGRVAGVDVNRGMIAVARSLPSPSGAPIEWFEGSADALPFGDHQFDTVLCQLGL